MTEFLGLAAFGSGSVPATDAAKADVATAAGARVMDLISKNLRPRDIVKRPAFENAIASVATTGGSTNAVLHLMAIAHEAGVDLALDDFDRISSRVPLLADLKPSGRFVATDLYAAGGSRLVARRLLDAGVLHKDAPTVSGRTIGDEAALAIEAPGQEVVRPVNRPTCWSRVRLLPWRRVESSARSTPISPAAGCLPRITTSRCGKTGRGADSSTGSRPSTTDLSWA